MNLPVHFNRGDRVKAEWFTEILRRIQSLENLRFNQEDFNLTEHGTGRSVALAPVRKPLKADAVSTFRYAYVIDVTNPSMHQLMVQFIKPLRRLVNDVPIVTWSNDGDPRVAFIPPNFRRDDFSKLQRNTMTGTTPIVRCDNTSDGWEITFIPRWAIRTLPTGALLTRCT